MKTSTKEGNPSDMNLESARAGCQEGIYGFCRFKFQGYVLKKNGISFKNYGKHYQICYLKNHQFLICR